MDEPYFQVPNSVFTSDLNTFELVVFIYLCRCGNNGRPAFPSYNTIASNCRISRRKAIDTVKSLEAKGFLQKTLTRNNNGKNNTNHYIPSIYLSGARHAPLGECSSLPGAHDALHGESGAPNKELIYKDTINKEPLEKENNGRFLKETPADIFSKAKEIVWYYYAVYQEKLGIAHPRLNLIQTNRVTVQICNFMENESLDSEQLEEMVDAHFGRKMRTDYNINHFATEGVLRILAMETRNH